MPSHKPLHAAITVVFFLLTFFLVSCNNGPDEVPFPKDELGYSQPVAVPLQFTAEKKIIWDTSKQVKITPSIKKLDIDALPSIPYDSSGFKPFSQPPEVVHFSLDSLPESNFIYDSLPSKPLQFKTSILAKPALIKTSRPSLVKGKELSIYDFGQIQGFPAKNILSILKDKNGLMWISSNEGLFRYDGENVRTFIPGPLNFPNAILSLVEDNEGNIWYRDGVGIGMIDPQKSTRSYSANISITTNILFNLFKDEDGLIWSYNRKGRAISIIDPETRTFKNLDMKRGLSDSLAIQVLQDDSKNIWVATNSSGTDIINTRAGKIKHLRQTNGLGSDSLSVMGKDNSGQIWLQVTIAGANAGIDAVNIKEGTIKHYKHLGEFQNSFTFNISGDNKNRIWISTNLGMELIDPEKKMIRLINKDKGLSDDITFSCMPDNDGRVWVGTRQGLNIIERNAETIYPLGVTSVYSMTEDALGNLWVATPNGVITINAQRTAYRKLNVSNGLSNPTIQSFTRLRNNIIVCTNNGFNIIDPIHKTIEKISNKEGLPNDVTQTVNVFPDKEGNLWLTGGSESVYIIDSSKNMLKRIIIDTGRNINNNNSILDVRQDHDGLFWLATTLKGVYVIDTKKGTIKYLNNLPGLKDTCNRVPLLDKYGRMWIGTDKGVYVADTKQGTITSITTKEGLSNNGVLSMIEYNGSVIVGTKSKVNIITAPVSGNKEASDTTSDRWKVEIMDQSEGLFKQDNSWATDCITGKGEYLWGDFGITSINKIRPSNDSVSTFVTGITVTNQPQYFINKTNLLDNDTLWTADTFYIKGQKLPDDYTAKNKLSWSNIAGPYNMPVDLRIPYTKNYLQFQFAQTHLNRPDTTWYTYVLEGIDKNWSPLTANTYTENYLNLPPGKYTFKVRSKAISGKWSEPASFSFTILPPWYKTWWAYIIWVLIAVGILRAYIVYRSRRLKKENMILEQKVTLRTNQLQKSLEDLKATQKQLIHSEKMASLGELTAGIAHEIQNPLNFVNNFSEVNAELIDEMEQEIEKGDLAEVKAIAKDIKENEQKINHHGKRADAIVKGMLQHSRNSSGAKEPTDINALTDEYLRLSYHGLRAKDKSFNATMKTDFDTSLDKINIVSQDVGRVILNLFTNAFYSVTEKKKLKIEGYEPTVSVRTKKLYNTVEIRVKDNGMGVPQKVYDKIFQPFFTTKPVGEGTGLGLSLSYDIIKAHHGELKLETKEGEGAEFIIILPV